MGCLENQRHAEAPSTVACRRTKAQKPRVSQEGTEAAPITGGQNSARRYLYLTITDFRASGAYFPTVQYSDCRRAGVKSI